MSWGSFLCGLISGACFFGVSGVFIGWLIHLALSNASGECEFLRLLLTKLKRGSNLHLSISVVDDDDFRQDNNSDDDDDGDGDFSPTGPSYDWSRN